MAPSKVRGIHPEDLGTAAGGAKNVHQDFDGGGLARAVRSDQCIDGALGNVQRQAPESLNAAELLDEVVSLDGASHFLPRPPRSVSELVLSRFQ